MPQSIATKARDSSDREYHKAFGTDERCRSARVQARLPEGFSHPSCGHRCRNRILKGRLFQHNMTLEEGMLPLSRRVEMDITCLGGLRSGGKADRDAPGKTLFVTMVSTTWDGHPEQLKMVPVKGYWMRDIVQRVVKWVVRNAAFVTDALRCRNVLCEVGLQSKSSRTGSGRSATLNPDFNWVNSVLGNIKKLFTCCYLKLDPNHANRYLAKVAWWFKHRCDLALMVSDLVRAAATESPLPHRMIVAGQAWGQPATPLAKLDIHVLLYSLWGETNAESEKVILAV